MTILAIHTAGIRESVAVITGKKVQEITWDGHKDESEKLLVNIEKVLKKAKVKFGDLDKIIVTRGPGPFSALRIGVTTANVLGHTLGIPVQSITTSEYWWARLKNSTKGGGKKQAVLLLFAGGPYVAHQQSAKSKVQIEKFEDVLRKYKKTHTKTPLAFFGDLTENDAMLFGKTKEASWHWLEENEHESFGDIIRDFPSSGLQTGNPVTPLYFKPPNISRPKNY